MCPSALFRRYGAQAMSEPSDPGELRSLELAIDALEAQRGVLGDHVVDAALQPLADKRDRLRAASVGEQRKWVTVLFADLVDSTPMARALDAEDLQQVMSRYFATLRSAIEAEGGTVEKFIGDAVMAVFGLYRAREDDAARAVRAGLAMVEQLQRLSAQVEADHGVRLRMRVGIDTGEVVVTGMAENEAGEFLVVGDTANRAARLQTAASPGTVVLSGDAARQVRGGFGLRRLAGLQLKGIDGPVDAYAVDSADQEGFWPEIRGIEGVMTRTVGRDDELALLQQTYTDVVTAQSRKVVTVVGEAGVGKSRLVHDVEDWLARLSAEVWVLRGRASPATQDVANGLLRSVFAERLGIRATDDPDRVHRKWVEGWANLAGGEEDSRRAAETVAAWLGFTLGAAAAGFARAPDPEALRRRGRAQLLHLLERLAERAPVVVLLEDLHWADSASLDTLEALAEAPGSGGPLLVLATARPALIEQRPTWGAAETLHSRVRLDPLPDDDIRSLVTDILQRADRIPAGLVELIVDTADGNPFYVEELVKWLVEGGVIDTAADRWRVAAEAVRTVSVPSSLRGLLQARLDSLDVDERAVIGGAAVVGRVFWDQAVARLATAATPPARDAALDHLATREVIFRRPHSTFSGSREFSFRHALMRDVAYEGVLRSVRRRHHALAAQWLEEVVDRSQRPDEHAADVAHHHEKAGAKAAAARWYLRAGRHAAGTFALDDALRLLGRARSLAPSDDPELICDVLLARESVLDRLGRRDEQAATLDELAGLSGLDPGRLAQVKLAQGRLVFFRGDYTSVPPIAETAAELARAAGRVDLEGEALMQGGRSLAYLNEHKEARHLLRQALAKARELGEHRPAGEALRLLGVVATNRGEGREGLRLLEAAREEHRLIDDREGEAMVTGQVGALLLTMGRLDEAKARSEEALAVFVETGHRYREGVMLTNLARIALEQDRLDDALEIGDHALRLTEEIADVEGIAASLYCLGDTHRLAGDLSTARDFLGRGLEQSARGELPYITALLLSSLAAADLEEGQVDSARDRADRAREAATEADVPDAVGRAALVGGMARLAVSDPSAVDLLREAVRLHRELKLQAGLLESLSVLAVALMDAGDVAGALKVVEEILPDLDGPAAPGVVEPGRVLTDVHRVLLAAGDSRAAVVARAAADYLLERSARVRDEQLRASFLATPVNTALREIAGTVDSGARTG